MSITSIKVPKELRERVQEHAARAQVTQAAVISRALDLLDRQAFYEQLRDDIAQHPESMLEKRAREEWLGGPVVSDAR